MGGCCGVREERLLRRGGGGGAGGCSLRADHDHGMGSGNLVEYSDLQITSRVRLVVLYYINFTTSADLTISVRKGYNSVESGRSPHTCIPKARKLNFIS